MDCDGLCYTPSTRHDTVTCCMKTRSNPSVSCAPLQRLARYDFPLRMRALESRGVIYFIDSDSIYLLVKEGFALRAASANHRTVVSFSVHVFSHSQHAVVIKSRQSHQRADNPA
jgi:hypothetical protein